MGKSLNAFADVGSYDRAKEINVGLWAPVLLDAVKRLERTKDEESLALALAENNFRVLADQATWAVTEISRPSLWKYGAQRYVSEGVLLRWRDAAQRGRGAKSAMWAGLRHEHVTERRHLIKSLRDCRTLEQIEYVLRQSAGCVVTLAEDAKLRKVAKTKTGWQRYSCAAIAVWDRSKDAWHVLADGSGA